jgi:alkylhydroperoxidase family enzyme
VRCGSPHEWAQHVPIASSAGLTAEQIAATARTSAATGWSEPHKAVLDAVDELHTTSTVSRHTWETLPRHYSEPQLIELILLIGHYHEVAFALNALKTPIDLWVPLPRAPVHPPADLWGPSGPFAPAVRERLPRPAAG